jgi:hypothetical protein
VHSWLFLGLDESGDKENEDRAAGAEADGDGNGEADDLSDDDNSDEEQDSDEGTSDELEEGGLEEEDEGHKGEQLSQSTWEVRHDLIRLLATARYDHCAR